MKETEVQNQILDYLILKRVFHFRNNSGATPIEAKSGRRNVRFGARGSPDIIAVRNGQFIGIECKAPKGKQSDKQSDHQKGFQKNLEAAGGQYILAYSLDEVFTAL